MLGTAALAAVAAAAGPSVDAKDIDFSPGRLTVDRGEVVTWRFLDGPFTEHNVRSRGRLRFKGSQAKRAGTHSARFTRPGTYDYVCTIHLGMKGKVIVRQPR